MLNERTIPVVDLFAGPGGLSEGFSCFDQGRFAFRVVLSVEKDERAYRTLKLRSFFRQFPKNHAPEAYYDYIRAGCPSVESLFAMYQREGNAAARETMCAEIGNRRHDAEIDRRIRQALFPKAGRAAQHRFWVLIGGPPCQAYSLIGRSRMRGADPQAFERDRRHFLYEHYLRIIAVHQPAVFVLENVKGILSSTISGERIFDRILDDLANPSKVTGLGNRNGAGSASEYRIFSLSSPGGSAPRDYVVKSELYGIPQKRHRVILVGIRSQLEASLRVPLKPEKPVTVEEAIGDLPKLRSGLSTDDSFSNWLSVLRGAKKYAKQVKDPRVAGLLRSIASHPRAVDHRGSRFVPVQALSGLPDSELARWLHDPRLGGVTSHETRGHMPSDIHRYLFAACYARVFGASPTLGDFPRDLLPEHRNAFQAANGYRDFADRFRVQCRRSPASTIVSHISKDGHYYIHYDPHQCRSLTVREAARLQTFPDNYFFEGNRTEQYVQVGNAVPPRLAYQIAGAVSGLLDQPVESRQPEEALHGVVEEF